MSKDFDSNMKNNIRNLLSELGLSSNEARVYLALTQLGEGRASYIAKKAGLPRTTTISILEKMKDLGYLTSHMYRGVTTYWIESPKALQSRFDHQKEIAMKLNDTLQESYRSDPQFPFTQVADTKSGIRTFIERYLSQLPSKSILKTIDVPSMGNYEKAYPEAFIDVVIATKQKKGIITHTLVPFGSSSRIAAEKLKRQSIDIRELPEGFDFHSSLWLANNMLVHFSGNPPFITAIKHTNIVKSFDELFDFFWESSSK